MVEQQDDEELDERSCRRLHIERSEPRDELYGHIGSDRSEHQVETARNRACDGKSGIGQELGSLVERKYRPDRLLYDLSC